MPTVIIVGAGITGLGAAYYLGASGISYTILEGTDGLGGTWHTQRWHGARCDSEFVKYSFSFKPFLSPLSLQDREQIHRYLESVAGEFAITEHIRFNTRVSKAVFDPDARRWTVYTNAGTFTAPFLINGNGYFSDPYVPAFEGTDRFRGEIIHTSALDSTRTFTGKNVVVVGSGSTAICCAPELVPISKSVVLVQRSPSYIYEISNAAGRLTTLCQRAHQRGFVRPLRLLRYALQCKDDLIFVGCRRLPRLARWFFRRHWLPAVGRASFEKHFRPRYNPWEQRIAVAIGLKEKLRTGQLSIQTGEIERFTASSIVLGGGADIPCDVCILATGFDLKFVKFDLYVGNDRIAVAGINFYKGIMMGGVPNYFQPVGVWHSAWTQRSETATRFAVKIMQHMAAHGFRTVSIDRREVEYSPRITPNYVRRSLSTLPRLYGTWDLPAIDNLVSYRFDPREFSFA